MQLVLYVYNPFAASGKHPYPLDKVMKAYQEHKILLMPLSIQAISQLSDLCNTHEFLHICIAGGDGTIHMVINTMLEHDIHLPIALLPAGTSNDVACSLHIHKNLNKNLKRILDTPAKPIDLGYVNGRYFVNIATLGTFTSVSQKVNRSLKKALGRFAYVIKALDAWQHPEHFQAKIVADNFYYEGPIYTLFILNGKTTGNFDLPIKSRMDDGLLDVLLVKNIDLLPVLYNVGKFFLGDYASKDIHYFQCKQISISSDSNLISDLDGEAGSAIPLCIECITNAIEVLGAK
ncbi:MAG: YegS/Rv2252/BmrU family lipid kinase [Erysipelotrichaceae bacterium]